MSHSNARRRTRHAAVALSLALAAGSVLASEPDATWLAAIEQEIARAEYEITWQTQTVLEDLTAAWHAPNRAQGFRTYFADEGIRMVPRSEESPAWEWRLSLFGWGRPGAVEAVEAAVLRAEANRIEYDRGDILEWYVNDARGLEQGFTLEGPPPGAESSWVWIELALGGTLLPVLSADGQAIDFQTADGMRAIHYAQLRVTDATEQALPARMEGRDGGIRLVFDDQEAVYPVTVDPLATGASWTAESNQANAFFGAAVATAGDVNADGFSDVVVGAYFYDNGQADEGRAFVYHGSAAGLATTVAWTAESNQGSAEFGTSVATAGDVNGDGFSDVIVGAVLYGNDQANEGRAFVYHGSAGGLATSASWTAESNLGIARFGQSVATAGDVNGDGFSDVIVGAYGYDNGQMNEGRAFAYHGSAAGLASGAAWTAESDQASANFGWSVATAGDVNGDGCADVAVGAYLYDNGQTDEGRTFVYHGSAAGLAANAAWTAESNQANASFGWSVATAGDVNGDGFSDTIVGAHLYENGQTNEGSAFVYHGSIAGLSTSASQTVEGNQTNANLGSSVATAGDVNGDGFADVIVGAPLYDNVEANEGRAFVYRGSAAGLVTTAIWKAESDQSNAHLGSSVATAGDVNGDGYSDVIAGAPFYDGGQTDEGRASVYHGSAGGLNTSASQTAESNQANAQFGFSVAAAGDVNGDGFADVIVGANGYDNGETNEGRAFVHHGSAAGLETTAAWMAESDQVAANFGYSVATAGDVNGDGFSDVIVGAFFYDNDQTNEGRAFVYHGSAAGLAPDAAWTAEGDQGGADFGLSVATAGDVNGDGFSDVIVGAHLYDNGQTNEGRAFVYQGSATGLATVADWTVESNQVNANLGIAVATAGDVNGDGYSDVIAGAYLYDNGETDEGRAFVYQGSAAGLLSVPSWTAESDQADANLGGSVAPAGDVNGDGFSEVVVGAYLHNNGQTDEGRASLYYGNGGPGLTLRPQQRHPTDTGPIAHLGLSDGSDSFRLALLGRSPFGRGRVTLESEVKPLGVPFDGSGTSVGVNWTDSGTAGTPLNDLALGLAGDTVYHWRVRLLYYPPGVPFQRSSRWLTVPWRGWQEAMLRTPLPAAGVDALEVDKAGGGQITLIWAASCLATDTDYAVYEGTLGDFTTHGALFCDTGGATTKTFTPAAGSAYYLVTALNGTHEGSYGTTSAGAERPLAASACLPQQVGACP